MSDNNIQSFLPFIPSAKLAEAPLKALLPLPNRPVHLDLGTGLGHFLEEMAQRHPDTNWIGLEYDGKILKRATRRIKRAGCENVRVFSMEARPFLLESVAPESLDHIWLNFPDPWPKKKHADRRHTYPWMLNLMLDRLKTGGQLHLATDSALYLQEALEGLNALPHISAAENGRWQRGSLDVTTKYERKWRNLNRPIYYADWLKQASAPVYPFEWQSPPPITFLASPPKIAYRNDNYLLKSFGPYPNNRQLAGFYLIDSRTGITTPGNINLASGRVELKGAWTPWKIDLMQRLAKDTRA